MSSGKQYGLQIPKKTGQTLPSLSLFGEDSDSDKSDGGEWLRKGKRTFASSAASKRQSKLEVEKALKEDATVFQYDEIYDELDQQKQTVSSKQNDRKPKYIQKLLVAAERRKVETERRHERQVQKEREAEGDEFKDKETFVTSAYKKKLQEFAKLDEEQKRQDMLEEIGDVTKQQDISGFYRHLYETTVGGDKKPKQENEKDIVQSDGDKENIDKKNSSRHYRKRKNSANSSESDNKDADSNLGSSSSSSSSSSSGDDSDDSGGNSSHSDTEDPKRIRLKKYAGEHPPKPTSDTTKTPPKQTDPPESNKKEKVESAEKETSKVKQPAPPPKPAIDIWKKRTVGPAFDDALRRYLERKESRLGVIY